VGKRNFPAEPLANLFSHERLGDAFAQMRAQGRKPMHMVHARLNLKRLPKRRTYLYSLFFTQSCLGLSFVCIQQTIILVFVLGFVRKQLEKGVAGRYIILCLPQDCADKINREQVPYKPLGWSWRQVGRALVNGVVVAHLVQMTIHSPGYGMERLAACVRSIFSRNRCHPHTNVEGV
jgi:hypothetical protein